MTDVILRTKINSPLLWRESVSRPRLIDQLNESSDQRLILVTAPAGYGKTTLLGEWTRQNNLPSAWLTLDEGDNDPTRFFTYLIAALQTIHEQFAVPTLEGLHSTPAPAIESTLNQIINEISSIPEPMVLILDDYQAIESQPIHDAVGYLIEHLLSQLHVVIASRIDPPLPLARWRARGQLAELREADLRFTDGEAAEFFTQTIGLKLENRELEVLASQTEGWAAGLQLAAISIKNSTDKSAFIAEFSGTHEFIVDYLTDEVLDKTPGELREFLLRTSILKQLCADLCDEVTGSQIGAKSLDYLRQNHLFLVSLDTERNWFRYHPLFADLLLKRLMEEQADLVPRLHQRASQWFLRNQDPERAIYHALQAEDYEGALSIIEGIAEVTLVRSEFTIFLKWLDAIPAEMLQTRPRLLVYGATASLFSVGDAETVEGMLDIAIKADQEKEYAGEVAAIRAMIATLQGDIQESIERSQYALKTLPEGNNFLRSLVTGNLSVAYVSTGDVENAVELFTNAAKAGEQTGNPLATVMALRRLAEMALLRGDLRQAWDICQRGLEVAVYPNGKPIPAAGLLMAVQGDILRERNQLPAAEELIRAGVELVLRWSELAAVEIYLFLARVKRSMGEPESAQQAIDAARQISERNKASRMAPVIISLFQVRLWLQLGQLAKVEKWEEQYQPFAAYLAAQKFDPKYHRHLLEIEGIVFARLRLAQGKLDQVEKIMGPLYQSAVNLKRTGSVIEILVVKAMAALKMQEMIRAKDLLEDALRIAEPQGYARIFIDEGKPMRELLDLLLEDVRRRETGDAASVSAEYLNRLLAALIAESVAEKETKPREIAGMAEPLSDRELEVLRFLPTSLTSTEIAQELYISPNTARFHIKNIYGKLGVHQRAAAVERARDLGLI
ncbi:MAG: LuxR C-terminal-related transcriptional regulator [Anaerolineales bacterium]